MGKVRDILRGIGLLSSAGTTVSNAGTRLLNIRNELDRLSKTGATGREKAFPEAAVRAARRAVKKVPLAASAVYVGEGARKAAAPAKRTVKTPAEKRRKAREYMRRKRAREKKQGIPASERERRRNYNRESMRRLRARRKAKKRLS